jgi:restriction system protein
MEPNEPTLSHTGQKVSISGDYSAACCSVVKQLSAGQLFPNCSEHGETEWSSIPPFVQTDWGTAALVAHWKHLQFQRNHAVLAQSVVLGLTAREISSSPIPSEEAFGTPKLQPYPEILLQHAITVSGGKTSEGLIIEAVTPAWFAILEQLERDPTFIYEFAKYPRKFEEMIAGAYERYGWHKVTLTPRSRDKGRDIIAVRRDSVETLLVDQVKAYSPNHPVPAKDVDALLGVLMREPNISTGIITTTSRFAPGIEKEASFKNLMPRLALRDGKQLQEWLQVLKPS